MRIVIKTLAFQIFCIVLFGFIYLLFKEHFVRDVSFTTDKKKTAEIIDCLFLATTIQSGVGYSDLYPITYIAKVILIIQQFVMISANVFLLYFITL